MYAMSKTMLTLRVDERLREALDRRAEELGVSVSRLVRDILERELVSRPLGDKIGALRGALDSSGSTPDWRRRIRERNWRD